MPSYIVGRRLNTNTELYGLHQWALDPEPIVTSSPSIAIDQASRKHLDADLFYAIKIDDETKLTYKFNRTSEEAK